MEAIWTLIDIEAPPEAVWRVLTDFDRYADWNPVLPKAKGKAALGTRLRLWLALTETRRATIRPLVTHVEPGRELRWLFYLGLPGLFRGERTFALRPAPGGTTTLIHRETFGGLLAPLFRPSLCRRRDFHTMNAALKQAAETLQHTWHRTLALFVWVSGFPF